METAASKPKGICEVCIIEKVKILNITLNGKETPIYDLELRQIDRANIEEVHLV